MAGPLESAGALPEPSEYAALTMDRHLTGLWTQRSPLRDADVPYLYGKFYSASRFDSLIDGVNREITPRLTDARRAGTSRYNGLVFPAINSFYGFRYVQAAPGAAPAEVIRVIADGKDGVIYDATTGQKTALMTKSAGAGKARFLTVGTQLYVADGIDFKKIVRSSVAWATGTPYALGQYIVDPNGNIQVVTQAGTSGGSAPSWATAIGATTTDGTVQWTCKGSSVANWVPIAPTTAPTVANTASGSAPSTVTPGIEYAFALTERGSPCAALASTCAVVVTTL